LRLVEDPFRPRTTRSPTRAASWRGLDLATTCVRTSGCPKTRPARRRWRA